MSQPISVQDISAFRRSRTPPEAGTGAKRQAGRRNREQITVEQKFISDSSGAGGVSGEGPGREGNPRLLSGAGDGDL